MSKTALVILAPGFEEIEAMAPIDVLRRAGVTVRVAGLESRTVTSSHEVTVQADLLLSEVRETPDAVILPGGMPGSKNLGASAAVEAIVKKVYTSGGICAAICAAPVTTLAKWGILDKREATCYPGLEKDFPPSTRKSTAAVVVDGNVVTSRGPGTALAFALTLARLLAGKATAAQLASGMLAE